MKTYKSVKLLSQANLPADLENLPAFLNPIKRCAREQGFTPEKIARIELAAEEILVNIFHYAYSDNSGYAQVTCGLDQEDRLTLAFEDGGIPFDPLSRKDPDITADIQDRPIGGLGVLLFKELMDDVHYRREGDKNILTISISS